MNIILWIVLGGIAGWIASMIVKTNAQQGIIGNIVVGIIGAIIGGFIGNALFGIGVSGFNVSSLLVAVVGSVIFVMILSALTGRKSV